MHFKFKNKIKTTIEINSEISTIVVLIIETIQLIMSENSIQNYAIWIESKSEYTIISFWTHHVYILLSEYLVQSIFIHILYL